MKRAAVPLQVRVQPQPVLRVLIACAGGLAGLSLALALIQHFPGAWPLLVLSPLGLYLAWRSALITPRILRWDGQGWHLHKQLQLTGADIAGSASPSLEAPAPVRLRAVFDFGFCMLLRAESSASAWPKSVYLPLSRATQGAAWTPLRAVLYSASTPE